MAGRDCLTIRKLFDFITTLMCSKPSGEVADLPIRARLVYRDQDGRVVRIEMADTGYSSGLEPELRVEMSTRELVEQAVTEAVEYRVLEKKDYGSNAGIQCDVESGPCSCGAWH